MSGARKTMVLHVGQHKTGSKALQSFLAQNRGRLRDCAILYPIAERSADTIRAYAISQYRLFALLRREAIAECSGARAAGRFWDQQRRYCHPFDSLESLLAAFESERDRRGLERVLVSAEDLFDMHSAHEVEFAFEIVAAGAAHLARLVSDFGYDAQVVVYLRRQDHLLGAHYVQFIKGSAVHDVEFDAFARDFAPRLDAHRLLSQWAAAFGRDRICVRPYERFALPRGIVPDFFESVLGLLIPEGCDEPPVDAESVNRSLGRDEVEFVRILNRRLTRGEAVFDRDAVLETALRAEPSVVPALVSAWLSPPSRRALIAEHDPGNAAIAREFLQSADGCLFAEGLPDGDESWTPYPGLTPEKAVAFAVAVHETIVGRSTTSPQ